jgi:hypothetical protein
VYNASYRAANLKQVRDYNNALMRRSRAADPEKFKLRSKAYMVRHPNQKQNAHFRRSYGITLEDRDRMLIERDWRCDLCGEAMLRVKGVRGPHVDHIHGTSVFRGIVHPQCNTAIGLLRDDPVLMVRAARYVRTGGRLDDWAPGVGEGLV